MFHSRSLVDGTLYQVNGIQFYGVATVAQNVSPKTTRNGPKTKNLKSVGSKLPADIHGIDEKLNWWTDETGQKRA